MNLRCAVKAILLGGLPIVMTMISGGCAVTKHTSHPPEVVRSQIRKVIVVPAGFLPREDFVTLKQPEQPSAGLPAAGGPKEENEKVGSGDPEVDKQWKLVAEAAWSEGWHMPAGAGLATAALLHPALGAFVVLSTNAPIGVRMPPAEKAKTEAAIAQIYNRQDIQRHAAEQIVEFGKRLTNIEFALADGRTPPDTKEKPDYRQLAAAGDTVLEVRLTDIGFVSEPGSDPLTALFILGDIRAVKVPDGTILYTDTTTYVSRKRKLSEWLDGTLALQTELRNGQASMAERIVEKIFLVQEIEPVSIWSGPLCMFDIYSPKTPGMRLGSLYLSTPQIDTLQPLFRWEPFPRERDRKADTGGLLSGITDITYDLKIWKVSNDFSQALVYEKTGFSPVLKTIEKQTLDGSPLGGTATYKTVAVAAAEHTLEKLLEPSTVYFWSIRARFKLDGQTRVTKWAYSRVPFPPTIPDPCQSDHIDFLHYYRFKTPAH